MEKGILNLIGLKIISIKSLREGKLCKPEYILFDDNKTYMKLEEQDYHFYKSCSEFARCMSIVENKAMWNIIKNFPDANCNLY